MFSYNLFVPSGYNALSIGKSFGLLFFGAAFISCSDDPDIVEEPEVVTWRENTNFQFKLKNQYNSHSSDEALYLLGRNTITTMEQQGDQQAYESAILWLDYDLNHQMPVSDRVFAIANDRAVRIASTRNPVLANSDFYLQMEDYDADFTGFAFPGFDWSEAMLIDELDRVLIPYFTNDEDNFVTEWKLLLVQLEIENDFSDYIDTLATDVVPSPGPVISLHAFDNNLYVTYDRGTLRIDEQGIVSDISINRPLYKIFEVDGGLVGVSNEELYFSPSGLSWSPIGVNDQLRLLKYHREGDLSLGFYNSQIFLFDREGDNVSITELENAGLEGHEITSLSIFQDNVYITTFSGVFEKPLTAFDIPKEQDEASGS